MAKHVKVYKDADTSVEISVESLEYASTKDVTRFPGSEGANTWADDDNRYHQVYTVIGTVSLANEETLRTTHHTEMGATYPKIEVYDKSAAPNYNTYSPVQFTAYNSHRVKDNVWRVTCVFEW